MHSLIETYLNRLVKESYPNAPIWNQENIRLGRAPRWNYVDGCMITALLEYARLAGKPEYTDFAEGFIDYYVENDGTLRGCDLSGRALDDIAPGRVLFELAAFSGKKKYRLAIDRLHDALMSQPRTAEGNWWHKAIYENQVWLDGIYMAMPFEAIWQRTIGPCDFSDIEKQVRNVRATMFDENKKLYYHGRDASKTAFWCDKETGCSDNFWLRAIGWYVAALADLSEITAGKPAAATFAALLCEAAAGILPYADPETGMYHQVVDCAGKPGNYLETSGSAMVAYAMLKGARLGVLDASFADAGAKTFDGICDKYLKETNGTLSLGGICIMAGLGPADKPHRDGSYAYYISEAVVENEAKGIAPLLLAYTERMRRR